MTLVEANPSLRTPTLLRPAAPRPPAVSVPAPRRPRPAREALVEGLLPLVRAEAAAEAPGTGAEPGDLEQAFWVRLLERTEDEGPPGDLARWVRDVVRAEARRARRASAWERPYRVEPATGPESDPERAALRSERRRALRAAVRRTPGRCPRLLVAMLSPKDPTYREIAGELGMSQGTLGPLRSRCLGCLRRMLAAEVAAPEPRGMER
ncbi:sigma-70 family RNA polymerase sigma factor [Streptomyces sp. AK02-01A]|uniref:sigma-70 family RNA polymerase sigma factor n=1 Tax=Streptomyces sp. AK02-01A TaxID=3028648 RepID=UPI0029B133E1|nr:sigma-70 family RNA polymerase sigma factor [Streptomyces sp. AK02-01A]MDX3852666.1 sigma-70 family RNA polymerase sigma factor [Streptomyces sp. AK02-01A]